MLTSTLPRWDGDSEPRFVLDLAKRLGDDFDVEIIAPHAPGAARQEAPEGVPVTRFRYWIPRWQSVAYEGGISWRLKENPLRLFQVPFFLCSMAWHVVCRLRREPRIELIHAHWIIPQGLVAVLVRGMAGRRVPVVTTSHGGDLFGLKGRVWTALKGWTLRRCDSVTVVSSAMAERVREIVSECEAKVIPMGTDLRVLFTPPQKPRQPPMRRLIFVGRLVEKKGVSCLLGAMKEVVRKHPMATLEIVGHGPLRPMLQLQAAQSGVDRFVKFSGAVPHAELPERYRHADLAVFPFIEAASGDQEGFGLVMVEAMGCGCAVIASALPAVRDVIRDGETGTLVPPRDIEALAKAICESLRYPAATLERAARGRRYACTHFDWSASCMGFASIYTRMIQGSAQ
jgi:phosphatidyl-myo-inositol dimannoside synthase